MLNAFGVLFFIKTSQGQGPPIHEVTPFISAKHWFLYSISSQPHTGLKLLSQIPVLSILLKSTHCCVFPQAKRKIEAISTKLKILNDSLISKFSFFIISQNPDIKHNK